MSAETLRKAAALMRERAEAAASVFAPHHPNAGEEVPWFGQSDYYEFDADDAPHIIGMSPAVALAVADWLDATAHIESWGRRIGVGPVAKTVDSAVTVARAYLGEDS